MALLFEAITILTTIIYFLTIATIPTLGYYHTLQPKEVFTLEYRQLQNPCNHGQGELMQLGLLSSKNVFSPKITVCRHPFNPKIIYWTKHTLGVTSVCQDKTFLEQVRNAWENVKLFFILHDYDIAFLSPLCDFVNEQERELAFSKENRVLLRTDLNKGAWSELERSIRDDVNAENSKVNIITGGIGWTADPLDYPQYVFKIVLREDSETKIYIGANTDEKRSMKLCDPIEEDDEGPIYSCVFEDKFLADLGLEAEDLQF